MSLTGEMAIKRNGGMSQKMAYVRWQSLAADVTRSSPCHFLPYQNGTEMEVSHVACAAIWLQTYERHKKPLDVKEWHFGITREIILAFSFDIEL